MLASELNTNIIVIIINSDTISRWTFLPKFCKVFVVRTLKPALAPD